MEIFFSVVIPLYNKERYIQNTVQSVLGQSFQNFEIIIVEDCSTDSSLKVVSEIVSDKIKIIRHDKNKGLSASRNTGIKNAKSDYVAFLDADDLWEINFLEEVSTLIREFPKARLFATNYQELFSDTNLLLPTNNSEKLQRHSLVADFFEVSLAQPLYCPSSLCVNKAIFDTIGLYDENITYGEDVDFNIRANSEFKLAYSTTAFVKYYTSSENQITRSKISKRTITDFAQFDTEKTPVALKKFLDFHRYIMAKHYRLEDNYFMYRKMKKGIKMSSLNYKQQLLLHMPKAILIGINKIKAFLISKGVRVTSYD